MCILRSVVSLKFFLGSESVAYATNMDCVDIALLRGRLTFLRGVVLTQTIGVLASSRDLRHPLNTMPIPSDHRDSQKTISSMSSAASTVHSFRTASEDAKPPSALAARSTESADSTVAGLTGVYDDKASANSTLCNRSQKGDEEGSCKNLPSSEGESSEEIEEWTFPDGGIKAWSVVFVRTADRHPHSLQKFENYKANKAALS